MHTPAYDERQMQLRKTQSDDKIHFRVRLHHLAKKVRSENGNWDQHFGVIHTGSEHQRNPNAPTFEDCEHGRTDKDISLDVTRQSVQYFRFAF